MPTNILMPALSPTMTEGKLASWRKKEGDTIKAGDVIAEIETDKATMEVEAVDEGVLAKIAVPAGTEGVKVNEVIAVIANEGEDPKSVGGAAPTPAPKAAPASPAPPAPQPGARPTASAAPPAGMSGGGGAATHDGGRVVASPLAKRMAQQAGIDLRGVTGSGPHGRIVKADVDKALSGGAPARAPVGLSAGVPAVAPRSAPPAAPVPTLGLPAFDEVPHSQMRRVIAKRLAESKRDAPHFYLSIDCQIDALLKLRADLNARAPKEGPDGAKGGAYKLSVNDFVIKAAALALMRVPAANAMWTEQGLRRFHSADISVAVAIADGLITPIVRAAESKGLAAISNEMKDLAERARAGKLKLEEFQGGTFSISNLGMYGIREFAAVINPPQACILAVGAGEQRPIVKDGALAVATIMTCTLSTDHRVVDGAIGAEFFVAFKKLIEDPLQMML
ncbi:MAG: pyruvate dehydrogenase complex dihydrolipoamide acetyltransferase [Alphaproteobacteria bacterium]|nr:pyruvate dehydrogenase complex dihydrolipoamide acetyltransferase [Alphaproteobacteria bacterium]